MDERLRSVTGLLLDRVEGVLREERLEAQTMKHLASVLKDLRDIRKDANPESSAEGILVTLAGTVEEYSG